MQLQRTDNEVVAYSERETSVMLTWIHGGEKVAVTGTWDNWETMYLNLLFNDASLN